VLPVWLLALAGAIGVAVADPAGYLLWMPVVFTVAVLLTFVVQLAGGQSEGYVSRAMASIGGAMVILAIATFLLALGVGS